MILAALLVYGGALAMLVIWNLKRGQAARQAGGFIASDPPAAANDNAAAGRIIDELPPHLAARVTTQGAWDPPDSAA